MAKKINKDAIMIKGLLKRGFKQCQISRMLNIKKEKVSYWARTELRTTQKRCKKLNDMYINRIQRWAKNQVTSSKSSRKIADMINSVLVKRGEVDKKGKQISVHFTTVNNYLKEYFGRPRKIRKVFYLSEKQKKKRLDFCEAILNRHLKPEQIFFTDESKVELGSFTRDSIRLDPEKKKWVQETYKLINRPQKKFEESITMAGGINYHGLGNLIFLEGTMNQFSYGQTLLFYKDDIKAIQKNEKLNIVLEQDGASSHTSKANIFLLNKLFNESGWIQNPPNSPDLAFPIEKIWGIIKPRVKRRDPKNIDQLKQFLLEEWNSVPKEMIQNLCLSWIERIKKVHELKGERLEPEYFKKKEHKYNWEKPDELPSQRIVYNDKNLKLNKQKEIKLLKRKIKSLKGEYTNKIRKINSKIKELKKFGKRDLKYMSLGMGISISNKREKVMENAKDEKKKSEEEKEQLINEIEDRIKKISKMNVFEYLRYINGDNDEEEDINSNSTAANIEEKIDDLEKLIKNKEIKYKIN